ncbi:MAG: substrate-binding domain-containing protein [Verrucomicrobiota bacterium]|jgi:LacI family transcriptional regulator
MAEQKKIRPGTKYAKVLEGVRVKILSGEYSGLLPGVQVLGQEYDVNLMTANKAVNMLVDEGLLFRIPRQGTYVKRVRSHTLAALLPNPYGPLQGYLIHGVEGGARATGNHFIFQAHREDPEQELEAVKRLFNDNKADGLVWWPCHSVGESRSLAYVLENDFPYVKVISVEEQKNPEYSSVISNDVGGAEMAVKHLVEQGCTKIAYVIPHGCSEWDRNVQLRRTGYQNVIKDAGLEALPELRVDVGKLAGKYEVDVAPELIGELKSCDGVFFFNDIIASKTLKHLEVSDVKVPEDLAVVGYDNIELAELFGITTVWQNFKQIGKTAVEVLMRHIEDRDAAPEQIMMEPELIIRKSSKRR